MIELGQVQAIWRYPVKGMGGESLAVGQLSEQGLAGDRRFALRDTARAEVQSCKTRPQLLKCNARLRSGSAGPVDVRFPDGSLIGSDDHRIHRALTQLVGRESTLEGLRPEADRDFYRRHRGEAGAWLRELEATFAREPGEPLPPFLSNISEQDADFTGVLGTFFLVTPLHLITTATLQHLKRLDPAPDWDPRRFRPNLVIDTGAKATGFIEQDWIGKRLIVGQASLDCTGTTVRCGAITRAQADFPADPGILRTVVREAEQNVGIYGMPVAPGDLKVGDPVYLA